LGNQLILLELITLESCRQLQILPVSSRDHVGISLHVSRLEVYGESKSFPAPEFENCW